MEFPTYNKAYELAKKAHEGQTRWGGEPYITHPKAVADFFKDDIQKTVAILHDVVEDTEVTVEEIRKEFGDEVAEAIDALSKRDNEEYYTYIARLSKNYLACLVKLQDLKHNLNSLSYKTHKNMYDKYKLAEMYLVRVSLNHIFRD